MAQGRVPGLNGVSSLRTVHADRRDQLALLGGLPALAVVAWLATGDRMGSVESMPGMALGGLGFLGGISGSRCRRQIRRLRRVRRV